MIPALALVALVELVLVLVVLDPDVLVVAFDPVVDVEDDDTEVTMVSLYCPVIGIKMENLNRA